MLDTNAGQLISILLRRLRDEAAIGLSRAFVRSMLSNSQRCINGAYRITKTTATFTTRANQQIYAIADVATDVLRIENVREGKRDLKRTTIRELGHISSKWFRHVGNRFQHFALPGRDMLVVYPSKPHDSSIEVVYTKLTTELVDDLSTIEITDDAMVAALDLAQMICLTKMREYSMLDPLVAQFTERHKVILEHAAK